MRGEGRPLIARVGIRSAIGAAMLASQALEAAEERCASEPIHRLGRVQSHGVILLCDPDALHILACSENAALVIGHAVESLLQQPLSILHEALIPLVEPLRRTPVWSDGTPVRARTRITLGHQRFEACLHLWDGHLVVELQPSEANLLESETDPTTLIEGLSQRLGLATDVVELCSVACAEIQRITGYQRVMAYEFNPDWHGEVIAECARPGEGLAYLGLHFPASDIPTQARELYRTVHLRVIADVKDEGSPMLGLSNALPTPDLSHALLRSVSTMHLQYLSNMGVRATMAVSLLVDGALWGLIVAHDDRPRVPPQHVVHALRVVCRVLGQLVSARLLALEYRQQRVDDRALMNLLERIQAVASTEREVEPAWRALRPDLLQWFQADGGILLHRGELLAAEGTAPAQAEAWIRQLDAQSDGHPVATVSLARSGLPAEPCSAIRGLLWIPSGLPGNGLLVWREEVQRNVFWGGDPNKPMQGDRLGETLGPRRSFSKWKETRLGESLPWTATHLEGARRVAGQWRLLVLEEERQRAEKTIRMLESVIMRLEEGLKVARQKDSDSLEIILSNPRYETLLGGGRSVVGQVPQFLEGTRFDSLTGAGLRGAVGEGRAVTVELPLSGNRWLELALTPIRGDDGALQFWVAFARDVSERRKAQALHLVQERALRDANERYDRILETSHEGILTLDGEGVVDYANSRLLDMVGGSEAALGRPFSSLLSNPELGTTLLTSPGGHAAVTNSEVDLLHTGGGHVSCELSLIRLRHKSHLRSGWLVMLSDLSERKALERRLLELNANLEAAVAIRTAELVSAKEAADEANREKSVFLANMSHELRSPLHGILGFTRLMLDEEDIETDRRHAYLRKVERNASNLLALVNDLLDSAKIESQGFSIHRQACDLVEIASAVAGEFHAGSEPTGPVQLHLPPAARCDGDPMRLAQILRNLIANAIRFSPHRSPVEVQIRAADGGWQVAVQDRGPGVPVGELEMIFQRFSQSSKTRTGAGGTGLGLHIARGIVKSHAGWIKAANREGGGAVFTFFIPATEAG